MRVRDIIGLIVALALAMGVAFLTRYFLTKEEKGVVQQAKVALPKILVANKILNQGDKINAGDLIWEEWNEAVISSYIKEDTSKIEDWVGAIVRAHFDKGEPILALDLIKPGDKGILAALVSPGKRAISIDVTAQSASSGLIAPGDYVDVVVSKSVTSSGGNQSGQSKLVAKNVKVLAVDVEMVDTHEKPKGAPKVVTLEVSPSEAEVITAATKEGTLSLSLHSIEQAEESGKVAEKGRQAPKHEGVTLIRGKEKTEVDFK
ncbi:MAG: Flp pilus assembly protein CpaB [Alphaproteobacteria bacterium]|nr:Flp pilus assembly protein CpaB [Alphaproteobacteria bacterium]